MGCVCRHLVVPPVPPFNAALALDLRAPPVVAALSGWLSVRWLPSAIPWSPNLDWLQLRLPKLSLSAHAVSTMVGLVNARAAILLAFKLDPLVPAHLPPLARLVATLNLRLPSLAPLAADWRPWSALALLNGQLDTIRAALTAKLFDPAHLRLNAALAASAHSPMLPSWRALLAQLKALLPVITMAELLKLDLGHPQAALASLAATIRGLRLVALPPLAMPHVVLQLIARNEAIGRLHASLGPLPFPQLRAQVVAKLQATLALLPPGLSIGPTGLVLGLPNLLPNPSAMMNAPTVAAAARLSATFTAGLNWNVPAALDLKLLTVGAPLASLAGGLAGAGVTAHAGLPAIRLSPCDALCDASKALAAAL